MTSSLVGSEMCIRDSAFHETWVRGDGHGSAGRAFDKVASQTVKANSKTCLLYTSDAADDM
eukprot:8157398-Prorocentrum_lima.AAC.1